MCIAGVGEDAHFAQRDSDGPHVCLILTRRLLYSPSAACPLCMFS